jgi:hypothetical protein
VSLCDIHINNDIFLISEAARLTCYVSYVRMVIFLCGSCQRHSIDTRYVSARSRTRGNLTRVACLRDARKKYGVPVCGEEEVPGKKYQQT